MMRKFGLFLVLFFNYFISSQCNCPDNISPRVQVEAIIGYDVTLVCKLNKCVSAAWFNLSSSSFMSSQCDSQAGCSTPSPITRESSLHLYNLSPYQTGGYTCVCREPQSRTIKCYNVVGVCQMRIQVQGHLTVYNGSQTESVDNYMNVFLHTPLYAGCHSAAIKSNCSRKDPNGFVTMMLDWCKFTCTLPMSGATQPCIVNVIFKVIQSLSTSATTSRTISTPTSEPLSFLDVTTLLPLPHHESETLFAGFTTVIEGATSPLDSSSTILPTRSELAEDLTTEDSSSIMPRISKLDISTQSTTSSKPQSIVISTTKATSTLLNPQTRSSSFVHGTENKAYPSAISDDIPPWRGSPVSLSVDPNTVAYIMVLSSTVVVILLLFATTLVRMYLIYIKGDDKDKTDVYRPSTGSVMASSTSTAGKRNDPNNYDGINSADRITNNQQSATAV